MNKSGLIEAMEKLRKGEPILIYDSDSRERETDIVVASQFITPEKIRRMRKDGGGLICTTLTYNDAEKLGLDYLINIYKRSGMEIFKRLDPYDIKYDASIPTFSITINHRDTFTGISDADRALTIRKFSEIIGLAQNGKEMAIEEFGKQFRAPGHVNLLIASKGMLGERTGHTELSTFVADNAGLLPTATIVEMLGDDGKSMSKDEAKSYAERNGLTFIEGKEIISYWKNGNLKRMQ
ncbi:MAG: 3,4-dihydroxy-2-butanone-4-phosphate synthase [Candidatus Micrarchaeia archaeon]